MNDRFREHHGVNEAKNCLRGESYYEYPLLGTCHNVCGIDHSKTKRKLAPGKQYLAALESALSQHDMIVRPANVSMVYQTLWHHIGGMRTTPVIQPFTTSEMCAPFGWPMSLIQADADVLSKFEAFLPANRAMTKDDLFARDVPDSQSPLWHPTFKAVLTSLTCLTSPPRTLAPGTRFECGVNVDLTRNTKVEVATFVWDALKLAADKMDPLDDLLVLDTRLLSNYIYSALWRFQTQLQHAALVMFNAPSLQYTLPRSVMLNLICGSKTISALIGCHGIPYSASYAISNEMIGCQYYKYAFEQGHPFMLQCYPILKEGPSSGLRAVNLSLIARHVPTYNNPWHVDVLTEYRCAKMASSTT